MMKRLIPFCLVLTGFPLNAEKKESKTDFSEKELKDLVALIDERQRNTGDYEANVIIKETEDNIDKAFEASVFRRDEDEKWMILFTRPKSEAGKGYLRIDKNIFMYEPALGKWERKTERASIVGTGSQRSDFDGSKLTEEFDSSYIAKEKLGRFLVHHIRLVAKANVEVGYPIQELWIDIETKNILKRQDKTKAIPEKLMRTTLYPKWNKVFSKLKKADVYVPERILIYDEVEKANKTEVFIKNVSFVSLPPNMFTKAWIESKSK